MKTMILKNDIAPAVKELIHCGVVAFPTETVYGLGGNAFCASAVQKIFEAKGRPADNPLIVHCADAAQAETVVTAWGEDVQKLAEAFWPGPLTMILPKADKIPDVVTAGLSSVGVRVPDHEWALRLIEESGCPIAAPSANTSGRPSPTKAEHVYHDLQGRIPYIIDGGDTVYGLESTVLDCTKEPFRILRPGCVTKEELEAVLGKAMEIDPAVLRETEGGQVASPGMKYRHYSPDSYQLILVDGSDEFLEVLYDNYTNQQKKVMILALGKEFHDRQTANLGESIEQVAEHLYQTLIDLEGKADIVLCPVFPAEGVGLAVMNRLLRAAGFKVLKEGDNDV